MTTAELIYQQLVVAGMTSEGACATLAQIQAESAFRPNNVEDRSGIPDDIYTANVDSGYYGHFIDDSYGYGLAQWTFWSRKKKLLMFARSRNVSIGNLDMQIEFLIREMKEDYASCWSLCTNSHDLYAITRQLLYIWENPAEKENNLRVRYSYAQGWQVKFSNTTVPSEELPSESKDVTPAVIRAVLNGDYGNGQNRIDRLNADGYDAAAVQKQINALYSKAAELKKFIQQAGDYYELIQDIAGIL